MKLTKPVILILIGILLFTVAIVYAAITYSISTSGTIQTVALGVPASIDWGVVPNSTATTKTIQVQNTGNTPCTLSLSTNNNSPSIISLTLAWNYAGSPIPPQETKTFVLTQTITATGAFTYDTIITATG